MLLSQIKKLLYSIKLKLSLLHYELKLVLLSYYTTLVLYYYSNRIPSSVVKDAKKESRIQLVELSLLSGVVAQGNKLLLPLPAAGSQMLPDPSNKPYMFPVNLGESVELVSVMFDSD